MKSGNIGENAHLGHGHQWKHGEGAHFDHGHQLFKENHICPGHCQKIPRVKDQALRLACMAIKKDYLGNLDQTTKDPEKQCVCNAL